jgi:hypothetical protein
MAMPAKQFTSIIQGLRKLLVRDDTHPPAEESGARDIFSKPKPSRGADKHSSAPSRPIFM